MIDINDPIRDKKKYKILVVDDQPINIHAIYAILEEDYEVFMANSAKEALVFCQETRLICCLRISICLQ